MSTVHVISSSGKVLWLPAATILPWAQAIYLLASLAIVMFGALALAASWVQNKASNILAAEADQKVFTLKTTLEQARAETARADANLLAEQRLTARERMRLERLERIVLPRRLSPQQYAEVLPKLRGLGPFNVVILNKPEPRSLGLSFVQLFQEAGIMGHLIWLPSDNQQDGVDVYAANEHGKQVANILWQTVGMAGGVVGGGVLPLGLEMIPKNENSLIIGENDAAFQGQPGQPGEGLDQLGRPVPVPR